MQGKHFENPEKMKKIREYDKINFRYHVENTLYKDTEFSTYTHNLALQAVEKFPFENPGKSKHSVLMPRTLSHPLKSCAFLYQKYHFRDQYYKNDFFFQKCTNICVLDHPYNELRSSTFFTHFFTHIFPLNLPIKWFTSFKGKFHRSFFLVYYCRVFIQK